MNKAGPFLFGSSDDDPDADADEKPQRTLELPRYFIARYPVTNAQFRMFVDAGGYQDERWWTPAGWEQLKKEKWREPRYWNDVRFYAPNQPVMAVSWYEAVAFCSWLSSQLAYEVQLPTEAEWEKAARGSDGQKYPWGNGMYIKAYANLAYTVGQTSPVGIFAYGRSPYGIEDMIGNVWEWTGSIYNDEDRIHLCNQILVDYETMISVRGGAWNYYQSKVARAAFRFTRKPAIWSNYRGFRIITYHDVRDCN